MRRQRMRWKTVAAAAAVAVAATACTSPVQGSGPVAGDTSVPATEGPGGPTTGSPSGSTLDSRVRRSTTTTTTTTSVPVDDAGLGDLVLADVGGTLVSGAGGPLSALDLSTRPVLGPQDDVDSDDPPPPDPVGAAALEADGFEAGHRVAFGNRSGVTATITIARFATPDGATAAAARTADALRSAPGTIDAGEAAGIDGSAAMSYQQVGPSGYARSRPADLVIFTVGRDVVTVAVPPSGERGSRISRATELAVVQRQRLVDATGG